MNLTGTATASVTADTSGNYSFWPDERVLHGYASKTAGLLSNQPDSQNQ